MMTERLTIVEEKCFCLINRVRDIFNNQLTTKEFTELQNLLREIHRALENKSFGCPTGTHTSTCTCREGHQGIRFEEAKKKALSQSLNSQFTPKSPQIRGPYRR